MMKRQAIHVIYLLFSTKQRRRGAGPRQIKLKNLTAKHLKVPLHVFFPLNCSAGSRSCGRPTKSSLCSGEKCPHSVAMCTHTHPYLFILCLPQLKNTHTHTRTHTQLHIQHTDQHPHTHMHPHPHTHKQTHTTTVSL